MSLVNSPVCEFSTISNGGVSLFESRRKSVTSNSTSPVGKSGFFAARSRTTPFAAITYSERSVNALSNTARSVLSVNANCKMPLRSRKSTKMSAPRSRCFCTQPQTTASLPMSAAENAPQYCVRFNPFKVSISCCLPEFRQVVLRRCRAIQNPTSRLLSQSIEMCL